MNITINITLFIQLINFILAYGILRYILFKPAVALLMAEEKKRATIREDIDYHYRLITHEKNSIQKQEDQAHFLYKQQIPPLLKPEPLLNKGIYKAPEYLPFSPEMVPLLIKTTTRELVDTIRRSCQQPPVY